MKKIITNLIIIMMGIQVSTFADKQAELVSLYEGEILAHDLYLALSELHPGVKPLRKIPRSEQRHTQVMQGVLEEKNIPLPTPEAGKRFVTEPLNTQFEEWFQKGTNSAQAACWVGVAFEEHDIAELREAQETFPEIKDALIRLERASENHLRAFYRNLVRRGGSYTPEALSQEDFDAIINR